MNFLDAILGTGKVEDESLVYVHQVALDDSFDSDNDNLIERFTIIGDLGSELSVEVVLVEHATQEDRDRLVALLHEAGVEVE